MAPRSKIETAIPMFSGSWNSKILLQIVSDVTGSRFLKMADSKREVVITQLLDKIATPFQRLTPIFGVQQPNGTIANSARCNLKSFFKDGGLKTGSSYNSASRQDSNAVPTANLRFSRSSNQMALLQIVPDVTGSQFFKMV